TIYPAFVKKDVPSFVAKFSVVFDGDAELKKEGMLATLFCGEGDAKTSHASDQIAFEADTRKAAITLQYLPVAELKDKTCHELQVVEKGEGDAQQIYAGVLSAVSFAGENAPEVGK